MEKTYSPQNIEKKWYKIWEQNNYFSPNGDTNRKPYCIVIPPPNVTGSLHMGHGFQLSIMDALIRYKRMCGYNTLWQTGTDHAGIATQIVVEQQLLQQHITRHTLGREEFVEKIWEWKKISGDIICQQQRRLGISVDWQRERFTMDPGLAAAVQHVFISLYEEGLIYRGKRLVNWDPVLNTAVSDLEVINEEQDGKIWYIKYPLVADDDGGKKNKQSENNYIVVATTRPETMLGDVAVAVHPDDERYRNLIGKYVRLPIAERVIPIIADDVVDREFGTGCVKITPAHDFNDYAMGQRHHLPLINIFTPQAQLNDNDSVPLNYRGLDRFAAREKIIAELTALDLLSKIEPHRISIPRGDRSNAVIEPYLTDQWFVKVKELAFPAIDAVKNSHLKFIPDNWSKTYLQWLENIQDWCISRQLWWGHRIPAWYDEAGNVYVGRSEEDIRKKHQLAESTQLPLAQDNDVLDTWFSSALWPFSSLGWPTTSQDNNDFKTFYPTDVLVTGFDIIFFWVVRMVMMGLKFTGKVPFSEVYITGLIRDNKGKKMSKSKGNIIDPVDLIDGIDLEALVAKRISNLMQPHLAKSIEKATRTDFPQGIQAFGADAVRFTFCALASTGRDINFDFGRLEGYRNFCTKLWNAARYVLMQFETQQLESETQPEMSSEAITLALAQLSSTPSNTTKPSSNEINNKKNNEIKFSNADLWIKTKLQQTIKSVNQYFAEYRFDLLAQSIYEFVWHDFCDWYLELSKPILAKDKNDNHNTIDSALKNGTRQTLITTLETILRLIHPLTPFISEEIWQQIAPLTNTYIANEIMDTDFAPIDQSTILNENKFSGVALIDPSSLDFPRGAAERATGMYIDVPEDCERRRQQSGKPKCEGYNTIMLQPYPIYDEKLIDENALNEIEWLKKIVIAVRNIRGEMNIAPKKLLQLNVHKGTALDKQYLEKNKLYLLNLAKLEKIEWVEVRDQPSSILNATIVIDTLELVIPLKNIINKEAEILRLTKEINKLKAEHEKLTNKLSNPAYQEKAPTAIIAKEQQRLIEIANTLGKLEKNLVTMTTTSSCDLTA